MSKLSPEPSAALLTPGGRGAVATIRFEGDCRLIDARVPALFRAANMKPLVKQAVGRIVFGHWGGAVTEEVVVCRIESSTLEIHCHGGDAAARRILDDLSSLGCQIVEWRALSIASAGLFDTECTDALAHATTLRAAEILLAQKSGLLRSALQELLAAWTDGVGTQVISRLDALLAWAAFGLHLTRPWSVVLAGRPNVGKSSLINALVGYSRSIVYDQPGTTRDVVTAETALEGWPVEFADTAGIRSNARGVESAGISRAHDQLAAADCRVLLIDVSEQPTDDDRRLLTDWPDAIRVAHKCDLPNNWGTKFPEASLFVSSLKNEGVDELAATIVARLIPGVPEPGTPIPITVRQVRLLEAARVAAEAGDADAFRRATVECLT